MLHCVMSVLHCGVTVLDSFVTVLHCGVIFSSVVLQCSNMVSKFSTLVL